jgi:hypothetical protein
MRIDFSTDDAPSFLRAQSHNQLISLPVVGQVFRIDIAAIIEGRGWVRTGMIDGRIGAGLGRGIGSRKCWKFGLKSRKFEVALARLARHGHAVAV